MTAAIVGWAHTPFGRLDGETVESLIVRVATEALADAGIAAEGRRRDRARPLQRGLLGAGFHRLAGAAGLARSALQARRPAWRMPAPPARPPCIRASRRSPRATARIVLVVGAEQMTTTPAPEIGRNLLKASYVREEADIDGGFAGIFGKIAGAYFQKYGDQSDALGA